MTTLHTQFQNYLKANPQTITSYSEWSRALSLKLESASAYDDLWDITLMDGLEDEPPYVSDDFQIGPNGAYELSDRELDFQHLLKSVSFKLEDIEYENGDLSDLGNEIGLIIGKCLENMTQNEISQFISGFRHGVSLTNGTHDSPPITKTQNIMHGQGDGC
jgi:hypothetical protein